MEERRKVGRLPISLRVDVSLIQMLGEDERQARRAEHELVRRGYDLMKIRASRTSRTRLLPTARSLTPSRKFVSDGVAGSMD